MNLLMTLFTGVLFVLLTPGILLSLPPGGSKLTTAVFHGVVFALVYHLTHKAVWAYTSGAQGFQAQMKMNY
jgi:hypothetical protein